MTEEEINDNLDALRAQRTHLTELDTHQGYQILKGNLTAQIRARRTDAFTTVIGGIDSAFQLAAKQSEIAGMQAAHNLRELLIDDINADIIILVEELKILEEEREDDRRDDDRSAE